MNFVDQVDLEAATSGRILDIVKQFTSVIDFGL